MQNFTFVLKHISGSSNKVVDALSRRCLLLQEFQVNVLGLDHLKEMYAEDVGFKEAYEACQNQMFRDRGPWFNFMLQEGLLFKGSKLCIPKCSMRENLLKEKHSGGLAGHFGNDKTYVQLSSFYYWLGMRAGTKICQQMSNLSICKGETTKYWIVSTITYSKETLGCCKYGFCSRFDKNTKG
jgi:hypothetical protein